jgi:peptide/nickel transport system substrate-binding protein
MRFDAFDVTRRALLRRAGAVGAGLGLTGRAAFANSPRRGGVLTLLINPEPPTLTTIAHTAANSVLLSAKVTEGLLDYDFDLNPKPQLATAWSVSPDGLQYTFKLRQGVRWHDGQPFGSADVAHSIALLREFHPRGRATFANVSDIRTPDAQTVVLVLSQPVPYLLTALAAAESPIVPKHRYGSGRADANPNNIAPIGTGPYRFKEWVRGSHIVYERNGDYWDKPKPYLDRLIVRFIPDAGARTAALETGEVHLAPGTPVSLAEIDRLKRLGKLSFSTEGYQYINGVFRLEFNLERPFFKDQRVRQAFAHAIDRDVVIRTAWYGHGRHTPGPVAPTLKRFFHADLAVPVFDLERANRLLDQAGFPRGPDGVRVKLTHDPMPHEGANRSAEYFKQALAKVGVDVTLRAQDFATYIKRVYSDRDFDFNFGGMSNTFDPTVGIQRLYWSKNFKRGLPFSNGSGYSNPETDRLLEAAAVELDPKKRVALWVQIQKAVVRDLPDLTLISPDNYTIADRRVLNHTTGGLGVAGNLADLSLS